MTVHVILLTRKVRLMVPTGSGADAPALPFEVYVTCRGECGERTGYLVDIKSIDKAVRAHVAPVIAEIVREGTRVLPRHAGRIIASLRGEIEAEVHSVTVVSEPLTKLEFAAMDTRRAVIRTTIEFAASHRLHSPSLSDDENRRLFGKCNNPAGHGHNYLVEASVEVSTNPEADFRPDHLREIIMRTVSDRFDHKYLNVDCADFDVSRGGVIPSVENIARVCHDLLERPVRDASKGHSASDPRLLRVTVWETERTSATYPAS